MRIDPADLGGQNPVLLAGLGQTTVWLHFGPGATVLDEGTDLPGWRKAALRLAWMLDMTAMSRTEQLPGGMRMTVELKIAVHGPGEEETTRKVRRMAALAYRIERGEAIP